jgi:ribonuclease BN (tRNA processing enzyme)
MLLSVLGSSGTYPAPNNPGSGYLVSAGGSTVLLDLGPGVFPALRDRVRAPDAVVLSHGHPDHCVDVFALLNDLRFGVSAAGTVHVMAPAGVAERIAAFVDAGPDHDLFRLFAFDEVGPGDERVVGDEVVLRFGEAVHTVPALVVSVFAAGRRLVYSGDTGPGSELDHLAEGTDVLLCEASLQGEPEDDRFEYHLYAVEAGRIAAAAGVGRLVVTHVPPSLDPAVSLAEAAAEFGGPVSHAVPGMEVEV